MKVPIQGLNKRMLDMIADLSLSKSDAQFVVDHFIEAELAKKRSHGVSKFIWESQYFNERLGTPFIEIENEAVVKVNGNKEIGPLAARYAIQLLENKVRKYNIAMITMSNMQRYGSLSTWANMIAKKDLIGIILNTSEKVVSHPDSTVGVLGTNPIGIGIPTNNEPVVLDMATAKKAMGLTWQSIRENKLLPIGSFYDAEGRMTRDPQKASAVKGFAGYKGFGLGFFVQTMCETLFRFPTQKPDKYEIGYAFIGINPAAFLSIDMFRQYSSDLVNAIKKENSRNKEILLPGEHAQRSIQINLQKGFIDIPENEWEKIKRK